MCPRRAGADSRRGFLEPNSCSLAEIGPQWNSLIGLSLPNTNTVTHTRTCLHVSTNKRTQHTICTHTLSNKYILSLSVFPLTHPLSHTHTHTHTHMQTHTTSTQLKQKRKRSNSHSQHHFSGRCHLSLPPSPHFGSPNHVVQRK